MGTTCCPALNVCNLPTELSLFPISDEPTNHPPFLASAIPHQSSPEDAAWSFTLPANTFTDIDGDTLTYSASLFGGSALPQWLAFDAATQTFSATPPSNFNGSLDLQVTASDGSLSASDTFGLTITPVNDTPTGINLSNSLVNENAATDTVVGTLSTIDPDAGDIFTYALLDDAGGRFAVEGDTLVVADPMLLDYEQSSEHQVTIRSTDAGGLSTDAVFRISLVDVTDVIYGGTAADTLAGAAGDDFIVGGAGGDFLFGGAGADTLLGGPGNDTLAGEAGSDTLNGGEGFDIYSFSGDNGTDTIVGFEDGIDKIRIAGYGSALDRFNDLKGEIRQVGGDVYINLGANVPGAGTIVISGIDVHQLSAADFIFA
jgi:Ca2+-binding RTX toxin-like protein